jgi:hypothetical protein
MADTLDWKKVVPTVVKMVVMMVEKMVAMTAVRRVGNLVVHWALLLVVWMAEQ